MSGQSAPGPLALPVASIGMDDNIWDVVARLVAWIDEASTLPPETERLLRILKVTEEAGEVASAVIGVTGQNPRKGLTHSWDDVQAELCDVVLTALVALRTITPAADAVFAAHLEKVAVRALGQTGAPASEPAGVAAP